MQLHEELRKGRETLGLSQADLAARAGIPRNQVVRAEKGQNITLETLRKIAVHLPLDTLTLLETTKLKYHVLPQPEKVFIRSMMAVKSSMEAFYSALQTAMVARDALLAARRDEPLPGDSNPTYMDELLLLKNMSGFLEDKLKETFGK